MFPPSVARRLACAAFLAAFCLSTGVVRAESALPTITGFTPGSGPVGTPVYVLGSNYVVGGTTVKFNATSAVTVNVNTEGSALQAIVPAGATTGPISVSTEVAGISSAKAFIVTESLAPKISEFAPRRGPVGTKVRIYGLNLVQDITVKFNGVTALAVTRDPSRLVVEATVPEGATTGPVSVTTRHGSASSTLPFTVSDGPRIIDFSPNSGPVGKVVTINGVTLTGATGVKFNGTVASSYRVNEAGNEIVVAVPAGAITGPISVVTPTKTLTTAAPFTVTVPNTEGPRVFGHTPSFGPEGSTVYIVGRNLTGATAVKFSGLAASSFTVNTEGTAIAAVVPARGMSGPITVTTPSGTIRSTGFYLFAPRFDGIFPNTGPVGTVVSAKVKNLKNPTLLKINGKPVLFTIKSENEVAFLVPPGATTGKLEISTATGVGLSVGVFTVTP